MGNDFSKGVDSAVAIITSIITGDIAGGLAGASAPWLAEQIKLHTGDNEAARLIAHSILGAVVAELQGNSGLAGGAGAVIGEVAADIIRKQLYGKEVKDLTEEEKETISALSQLATGLATAAGGGNIGDASAAISSSKNAVENNSTGLWHGGDIIGLPPETGANYDSIVHASAAGYLTLEETFQIIDDMNSGKYMYDPLREDLKRFPEDLAILVTPYGDYIAFRDADSWGDYAIAISGVLPFVKYIKVAGKVVKVETKAAQTLVKEAETAYKAGNVAEGNRLMNQVASQSSTVETTVVKESNNSSKMTLIQDSQASSGVTKPTDTGKTTDIKSKGKQKDDTIWTETKERTSVENAYEHWNKHKSDFPEYQNAKQYVDATHNFVRSPPEGTLIKVRKNGDTLYYNPKTNIFAIKNANGTPRTMYKPEKGMEYWNKQK